MVHIPIKTKRPFTNRSVYSKDFCRTPVQYERSNTGTFWRPESPYVVSPALKTEVHSSDDSSSDDLVQLNAKENTSPVSTYNMDYRQYETGSEPKTIMNRKNAPKIVSKPVTEPPFEITENLISDGTTYRETFSTRHPTTYTDYPAAGLITRGGRLRSQRENYEFYPSLHNVKTDPGVKLVRQTKANFVQNRRNSNEQDTKEFHEIRVKHNLWPFLEHKNSCFYNVAMQDDF
ncbi:hypothetical protein PHET_02630 [Paragonimus heterotremus]|uniref:Uncharacterized protein n=1 Tax=Paragonimus heterotremus TaxID=100268 RepID=A0A8J4SS17_9TREM|nr:hypothetical protein PHET_02630 [Paragonimus heterotremus]